MWSVLTRSDLPRELAIRNDYNVTICCPNEWASVEKASTGSGDSSAYLLRSLLLRQTVVASGHLSQLGYMERRITGTIEAGRWILISDKTSSVGL